MPIKLSKGSQISRPSAHEGGKVVSLCTGRLYPRKYSWYSFLLEADTWPYLVIRLQEEVTIQRLIINPLKGWRNSNVWNNPSKSKILVTKQL